MLPFWEIVSFIVISLFVLMLILISVVLVLENRNPTKTLAWLVVMVFIPIVGFIFYMLFGQSLRKRKLLQNKEEQDRSDADWLWQYSFHRDHVEVVKDYPASKRRLINLLLHNSRAPFTMNNRTALYKDGLEAFPPIFADIERAEHHIHLEFYIVRDDKLGKRLKESLIAAAARGVEVRFLYDALGCKKLPKTYVDELKAHGVQMVPFLPLKAPILNSKVNYRNHRKIVVVDGSIGYIGGLNIGDEYLGEGPLGYWRDTHMRIEGEAVKFLQRIFCSDWYFAAKEWILTKSYFPSLNNWEMPANLCPMQIVSSGPDSDYDTIMQAYFTMLGFAQEHIYITTPYFIPEESLIMALKTAALSGVDVRIIFPAHADHAIVHWASMSYLRELHEVGVKIYFYEKGFNHAKVLTVDSIMGSVGSTNLDLRSFQLNFEVNAILYDNGLIQQLEAQFMEDLKECKTYEEYVDPNPSLLIRFRESIARLFSPLL